MSTCNFPFAQSSSQQMSMIPEIIRPVLPDRNKLYRFAYRLLGSVEEAEDVVQDVFLKLWDRKAEWAGLKSIEAWSMRMTRNLSLDRIKANSYRRHDSTDQLEVPANQLSPDRQAELNESMSQIERLINNLPEKQRMVIQLRDIEGYSYDEIAQIMEVNLSQVKVYLHRARKKIRGELGGLAN